MDYGTHYRAAAAIQRVKIITSHPPTRRIEVLLKDGSIAQVTVIEVSETFSWPIEGELWTIHRQGLDWVMGRRMEMVDETFPIEGLQVGEMKIAAGTIYDESGQRVVAADMATAGDGQTVFWDAADGKWVVGPSAVADKNFVHNQLVASTTWNVNHGLNKRPSVSVVDSGDTEVIGDVTYIDNNHLTITFSAPFGGKAYCN